MGGSFLLLHYWMTQGEVFDDPDPTFRFGSSTGNTNQLAATTGHTGRFGATTGHTGRTSATTTQ